MPEPKVEATDVDFTTLDFSDPEALRSAVVRLLALPFTDDARHVGLAVIACGQKGATPEMLQNIVSWYKSEKTLVTLFEHGHFEMRFHPESGEPIFKLNSLGIAEAKKRMQ